MQKDTCAKREKIEIVGHIMDFHMSSHRFLPHELHQANTKRNVSYAYETYFIPCKEASKGNTVEDACFFSVAEAAPDTQTNY